MSTVMFRPLLSSIAWFLSELRFVMRQKVIGTCQTGPLQKKCHENSFVTLHSVGAHVNVNCLFVNTLSLISRHNFACYIVGKIKVT